MVVRDLTQLNNELVKYFEHTIYYAFVAYSYSFNVMKCTLVGVKVVQINIRETI